MQIGDIKWIAISFAIMYLCITQYVLVNQYYRYDCLKNLSMYNRPYEDIIRICK